MMDLIKNETKVCHSAGKISNFKSSNKSPNESNPVPCKCEQFWIRSRVKGSKAPFTRDRIQMDPYPNCNG